MNQKPTELDFVWFDAIDSTTRVAKEYLAAAPNSPRAFVSKSQTQGVGRLGQMWFSPKGNLYLSLVVPGSAVPGYLRDKISLVAGVSVCEWILRRLKLSATIKWPNDIVIDGCKVAGILCETSITGEIWNGVCISVGLNLGKTPILPPESKYFATSILDATGQCPSFTESAQEIAATIMDHLRTTDLHSFYVRYSYFASSRGSEWISESGDLLIQQEFLDDGSLGLKDTYGSTKSLQSSNHNFEWIGLSRRPVVVADIGNSRVKLAVVGRQGRDHNVEDSLTVAISDPSTRATLSQWLGKLGRNPIPVVYISSVNAASMSKLQEYLLDLGWPVRVLKARPLRLVESRYERSQMGMDRTCMIEGALALRGWGQFGGAFVVVSLGTATTIDFLDDTGVHHGGVIGVGLFTGLKALKHDTDKLPDILPASAAGFSNPVTDTSLAMSEAAVRMQASWIEKEVFEFAARIDHKPKDLTIILTGGGAKIVFPLLQQNDFGGAVVRVETDLGLLGAALIVRS